MIRRQPHEDFLERRVLPPIGSLLTQANCFVDLQAGKIHQLKQTRHRIGLVTYGENIFASPRIGCVDYPQSQFLGHHFGCKSISENRVIQKVWSGHDKCAFGTQTTGDLVKCFRRVVEVLDDHPTSDQIKAIVRKRQLVERSLNERLNISVGR